MHQDKARLELYSTEILNILNRLDQTDSFIISSLLGYNETKEQLMKKMDQNGDGQVTIEDVIIMALKIPGIKINREDFIKKEFRRYYSDDVIKNIVEKNPLYANIPIETKNRIYYDQVDFNELYNKTQKDMGSDWKQNRILHNS